MFSFVDAKIGDFNLKFMKSSVFSGELLHCFTTRVGGDTPNPLESFPISAKDFPEYKEYEVKNQKVAVEFLGGKYEKFIMPNQQHTDKIAVIKSPDDIAQLDVEPFDGVVTNLKGYTVCMVFADCVPVLLFDEKKKILACVHAGWKGTAKNIVQKAVKIMEEKFSCCKNDIKAVIGAAICGNCFEVNSDVASQLAMTLENNCDNIFIEHNGKFHVDLKALNQRQLNEIGVETVDVCEYCTSCQNNIFYSYRADDRCTGRHGMLAMIKE
ncbi:MAG: peptidoglycan editing factor PgeF [bacterium]|nr:peptidoglycan editing factor PgeF [bacterium]